MKVAFVFFLLILLTILFIPSCTPPEAFDKKNTIFLPLYRKNISLNPLQAYDSSTRRLGRASSMAALSGGTGARSSGTGVSRSASTISRAGFGSTGRSYSSGG